MYVPKTVWTLALAAIVGLSSPMTAEANDRQDRRKAKAIVGALVGVAALAAASKRHRHGNHRHHSRPRHVYGAPFSPAANVTCYPREQTCYRRNGRVAGRYTRTYYGR